MDDKVRKLIVSEYDRLQKGLLAFRYTENLTDGGIYSCIDYSTRSICL